MVIDGRMIMPPSRGGGKHLFDSLMCLVVGSQFSETYRKLLEHVWPPDVITLHETLDI